MTSTSNDELKLKPQRPSNHQITTSQPKTSINHLREQAISLLNQGRRSEAEKLFCAITESEHADTLDYCKLASIFLKQGNHKLGIKHLLTALKRNPNIPNIHHNLAKAYVETGEITKAKEHYQSTLNLEPNHFGSLVNLSILLSSQGDIEGAIRLTSRAIALEPESAEAHRNLGNYYQKQRNYHQALECFAKATSLKPDYVSAWESIGVLTRSRGHYLRSTDFFLQALKFSPNSYSLHFNLGLAFADAYKSSESLLHARTAYDMKPNDLKTKLNLSPIFSRFCDFSRYPKDLNSLTLDALKQASDQIDDSDIATQPIQRLHQDSTLEEHKEYLQLTQLISQRISKKQIDSSFDVNQKLQRLFEKTSTSGHQHLHIGFVSGDFRSHVVMRFFMPLLEQLASHGVRTTLYSSSVFDLTEDETNQRARQLCDEYYDIHDLSTELACQRIQNDQVDILIDLAGHSAQNRIDIFCYRNAPIQCSWLGYPASTGLDEMDFILVDHYVNHPNLDSICSETPIEKPGPFLCFSELQCAEIDLNLPEDRNGFVTIGTLNNPRKYTQNSIRVWAKILKKAPNAQFLIARSVFESQLVRENIFTEFSKHGIPSNRITLKTPPDTPSDDRKFLSTYNEIDIALDTFPYTGTTTTLDTLWMGVPLITLSGTSIHQRNSASILHFCGHSEWIADTEDEYVNNCLQLIADQPKRRECRSTLRSQLLESQLADPKSFTIDFLKAINDMTLLKSSQHVMPH